MHRQVARLRNLWHLSVREGVAGQASLSFLGGICRPLSASTSGLGPKTFMQGSSATSLPWSAIAPQLCPFRPPVLTTGTVASSCNQMGGAQHVEWLGHLRFMSSDPKSAALQVKYKIRPPFPVLDLTLPACSCRGLQGLLATAPQRVCTRRSPQGPPPLSPPIMRFLSNPPRPQRAPSS